MADPLLVSIIVVAALVVVLGLMVTYSLWKKSKGGRISPSNYRAFFLMGLVWLPIGVILVILSWVIDMPIIYGIPLFALGLIFLIIGLWNRNKWKRD